MLKRSLLSLSVAAIMVSTSGCKISSVEDNDVVDPTAVTAQNPDLDANGNLKAAHPFFDPAHSFVQFGSDFIFSAASKSDGTANTGTDPSSPSYTVAGAIDDLDGWSTTAAIDIPFSAEIDPDTVFASGPSQNVFLIKLEGGKNNNQVDALDFAQIAALGAGAIGAGTVVDYLTNQLTDGKNYAAKVVSVNGGTNNLLRILPKKPLEPRTKYIVVVTNGILDPNGDPIQASANYTKLLTDTTFASPSLASINTLLEGMTSLAAGFLGKVDYYSATPDGAGNGTAFATTSEIVFTAPITTTDPTYALRVNAAPGIFLEDELAKYKTDIQTDSGATDVAVDMALAKKLMDATASGASAPAYAEEALLATVAAGFDPVMPVTTDAEKDAVRATDEYKQAVRDRFDNAGFYATATAVFKGAVAPATDKPAPRDFGMIPVSGSIGLPGNTFGLTSTTMISQGYISLPQYTATMTDSTAIWRSSEDVGDVFDTAFQAAAGTYPPKDLDGSTNVTYRFPFVAEVRDAVVPVLVTTPTSGSCTKGSGWPVAIFMHGITVDRAATLAVADQLANNCMAMVAIDQPHHGIAPLATDRNGASIINSREVFSVDHSVSAQATPWAYVIANTPALDDLGIAERHEGYYLNGSTPGAITYDDAKFAAYLTAAAMAKASPTSENLAALATATSDVGSAKGKSGDFFIRLDNFQRTRDNIRQSVMDLLNVAATIGDMDVDASSGADFDTDKVFFIGHSLGAIVGTTFVSVINDAQVQSNNTNLPTIQAAVLANPGGQLSKLLENSVSFSASLIPGLAAKGLTQGTLSLEQFFTAVQAHVDQADPISYAASLADTDTPVLLFEMVGGGAGMSGKWGSSGCSLSTTLCDALANFPADLVVPNKGYGDHELVSLGSTRKETAVSYMAGTDPLIDQLGLTQYDYSDFASDLNADTKNDVTIDGTTPMKAVIKFEDGTHGTFASGDVPFTFAEMMSETVSFLKSNGVLISRYNNAVDGGVATVPAP